MEEEEAEEDVDEELWKFGEVTPATAAAAAAAAAEAVMRDTNEEIPPLEAEVEKNCDGKLGW